jgi:hypothetical protein
VSEIKTTDETLKSILKRVDSIIAKKGIKPYRNGNYFSNSQLDDLRRKFEKNGFETARVFIAGKMTPGTDKKSEWELKKNEILLDLLEQLNSETAKILDVSTKSYVIGKLNPILMVYKRMVFLDERD